MRAASTVTPVPAVANGTINASAAFTLTIFSPVFVSAAAAAIVVVVVVVVVVIVVLGIGIGICVGISDGI